MATQRRVLVTLKIVIVFAALVSTSGWARSVSLANTARRSLYAPGGVSLSYLPVVMNSYTLGSGAITGTVRDGQTGQTLAGAQVCTGKNCAWSDGDGKYVLSDVPSGVREVAAQPFDSYLGVTSRVTVIAEEVVVLDLVLSPWLQEGEMRIVLTWDETPSFADPAGNLNNDMDAYLWAPGDPEPYEKIYWANPGNCGEAPFACLVLDVKQGSGPETVLIGAIQNRKYVFAVYYYADALDVNGVVPPLTQSEATVRVYDHNGLVSTLNVPHAGEGVWWHVFELDGIGSQVVPLNLVSPDPPLP